MSLHMPLAFLLCSRFSYSCSSLRCSSTCVTIVSLSASVNARLASQIAAVAEVLLLVLLLLHLLAAG
jgi:hypothetical protein